MITFIHNNKQKPEIDSQPVQERLCPGERMHGRMDGHLEDIKPPAPQTGCVEAEPRLTIFHYETHYTQQVRAIADGPGRRCVG